MSETCRLRRGERYEACGDEGGGPPPLGGGAGRSAASEVPLDGGGVWGKEYPTKPISAFFLQ